MKHNETNLQINCIKWFDYSFPQYRNLRIKIDNEGKRSVVAGSMAKRAGLLPGAADLFIAIPITGTDKIKPGLFIEFKSGKNKQTENQLIFEKSVKKMGYSYFVIYTFDEFVKCIENYLNTKPLIVKFKEKELF